MTRKQAYFLIWLTLVVVGYAIIVLIMTETAIRTGGAIVMGSTLVYWIGLLLNKF